MVILHQSKNPVRVCNACYNQYYHHLTKPKKLSTCGNHNQTSTSSTAKVITAQKQASDVAEIQQSARDCLEDSKDSRVEEWVATSVSLASEQISEHLSKVKKESDSSVDEAIEAIKLETEQSREEVQATGDGQKSVEQLNGSKVDSYNDQTSESDDDHLNDLSSVEDILDELIGKVRGNGPNSTIGLHYRARLTN